MSNADNPMAEVRPAASLTANLLARRGGARPAMRRPALGTIQSSLTDDLGWNDMGEDQRDPAPLIDAEEAAPIAAPAPVSPVKTQLQVLAAQMGTRSRATRRGSPASLAEMGRKAAFTLRLDAERHLRLRLLSAVSNRSAQQLLVEALDELIARNEQVKALAMQVETPPSGA